MTNAAHTSAPVLVVDDDAPIRDALRTLLEDEGYTVLEAETCAQCQDIVRTQAGKLIVLLDNLLPDGTGLDLLKRFSRDRAVRRRTAFILMTAQRLSRQLTLLRYLSRLKVPRLTKPFDIEDVLALVAQSATRLG